MEADRTDKPQISVIVPCYNVAPYLEQCLESILLQTLDNHEIICINDGSTDGTLKILQVFQAKDSRIHILDQPNQGYGASCNRGIDEALGVWIAIVEADDWIEPQMFRSMLDFASEFNEEIDIIKTPYWCIWLPDTNKQHKYSCNYRRRIKPEKQPFVVARTPLLLASHPSIWTALYRSEFLKERKIRFREYQGAGWADNPFLIETLVQAKSIIYLDKPFYCYRMDTPEKLAQFARHATLLPLERWHEMMDILDRLKITDDRIVRAHNARGFAYLQDIIQVVPLSNEEVHKAARQLFYRMDAQLVLSDPAISPQARKMFCEIRKLPEPTYGYPQYLVRLIKQGLYSLLNEGPGRTLYRTADHFRNLKKKVS